jgi:signal transduction histidine kinase/CheY-like chemotaxis protein/HPt (histidine-containing phosphotransfer) domain-containing protein
MTPEPHHDSNNGSMFRRSRSIAVSGLAGLLFSSALFAAISFISLLGFFSFQEVLTKLSQQTFPETTTKAQISVILNELLQQTTALHHATNHPARRIAYQEIETQFQRIDDFSRNLHSDTGTPQGPKIGILKSIAGDLNELVQERLLAHSRLQQGLGGLLQLNRWVQDRVAAAVAVSSAGEETAGVHKVRQLAETLIDLACHAGSAQSLQRLRDDEKIMVGRLADMATIAGSLSAEPGAVVRSIHQRLAEELITPSGILALAHNYQRLVSDSRSKATFAESLVREKEEANIAGLFELTSAVSEQNLLLASEVRSHIAVLTTLFLTSMALAVSIFYYFRRMLIARLQRLNRQVLAMVAGQEITVAVQGADEITEIAASVNYFAVEMRKAKAAAEEAAMAKADFLAHMSHEIRTPMNAILGFSELALQSLQPDDHRDSLAKINTASHTLLGIVNTVLDYSKIEAGKFIIDHAPFDLRRLLENLASLISLQCEESGLEFYCQIGASTPYALRGDGLRLGQVLTNLITNAFKFTERGSVTLHISAQPESDDKLTMRFAVHDTGCGIDEDQVEQLFQPFTQADTSMIRRAGGTGLGLAICKRLVEMMGGHIDYVRSEEGGSIFSFSLPLLLEGQGTFFDAPPGLAGTHVLVMSEVARTATELSWQLHSFGCNIVQTSSPEEVLAAVVPGTDKDVFDILIVDCSPLGRRLHDLLPLVEATGWKEPILLAGERRLVFTTHPLPSTCAFLAKPILPERLLSALLRARQIDPPAASPVPPMMGPAVVHRQTLLGRKVLLVEDNEINRQVALGFLRAVGMAITTAANGAEALDILRQSQSTPFDVVLMDLQMPVMDGYKATQAIRRLPPPTCTLPIVALTAHAMPEEREKCLRMGMLDLLAKPIDPAALYRKLAEILGAPPHLPPYLEQAAAAATTDMPSKHARLPGIDLAAGRSRVMGDDQLYRLLLRTFIDTYGHWSELLHQDLSDHLFATLREKAHTLKGASGNLGMSKLMDLSAQLEMAAKGEQTTQCADCIAAIEKEVGRLCGDLQRYLAESGEY